MSRTLIFATALVVSVTLSPLAFADSVFGSSGASWQTWVAADLNENGTPYWDKTSHDGSKENVGYCLTGKDGSCVMTGAPGYIPYWGMATGEADPNFYLRNESASRHATMGIEISGLDGSNKFGWYDVATGTRTLIFSGPDSPVVGPRVFTPTLDYGFWFEGDQGVYFTNSALNTLTGTNPDPKGMQMFSIFQETAGGTYWIAMEDRHSSTSDLDYNDMIVKISSVPDGGMTLVLLGGAFVGLETLRRKLRS